MPHDDVTLPDLQRLGWLHIGETAVEKLQLALAVEHEAVKRPNDGIGLCVRVSDNGPPELLDQL